MDFTVLHNGKPPTYTGASLRTYTGADLPAAPTAARYAIVERQGGWWIRDDETEGWIKVRTDSYMNDRACRRFAEERCAELEAAR